MLLYDVLSNYNQLCMMRIGLEIQVVWLLLCIASLVPVSSNYNYTMYDKL